MSSNDLGVGVSELLRNRLGTFQLLVWTSWFLILFCHASHRVTEMLYTLGSKLTKECQDFQLGPLGPWLC